MSEKCWFAYPGTYGHECGKPATIAMSFKSERTIDGIFWANRCPECAKIRGGENSGFIESQPLNPSIHINKWKQN